MLRYLLLTLVLGRLSSVLMADVIAIVLSETLHRGLCGNDGN